MTKGFNKYILLILLLFSFDISAYESINNDNNLSDFLLQVKAFRNKAMSYAYYLRAAYLKNRVRHFNKRKINYYQARNDIYEANYLIRKAIEYTPNSFYLWKQFGDVNEALGDFQNVLLAYKNLVNISPTALLCQKLGIMYEIYNQPELAVQQYEHAIQLMPDDLSLREKIIDLYIQQAFKAEHLNEFLLSKRLFKQALIKLKRLIKLKENARYFLKYGLLCELIGQPKEAVSAYNKAIKLDPNEIDAYIRTARIYCELGNEELRNGNESAAVSNYFHAAQLMTKIVPSKSSNKELLNFTAYLLSLANTNLDLAEDLIKEALKNNEDNFAYLDTLGWILFKKGNAEEALEKITKAVQIGGDDPVIMNHLGDIYFKLGKKEKAREMWLKSLKLDENNISIKKKLNEF